jgi:hypothetical protein
MTGNVVSGNILINSASSVFVPGFHGWYDQTGTILPPNPQSSVANVYFTYGEIAPDTTRHEGAGSDSNPQHVDPRLSCWTYEIAPGSPVFAPWRRSASSWEISLPRVPQRRPSGAFPALGSIRGTAPDRHIARTHDLMLSARRGDDPHRRRFKRVEQSMGRGRALGSDRGDGRR